MAHVREPGAEGVDVGPREGTAGEELDVVGNEHDVPGGKGGVYRPGGVGHYQGLRPQHPQKTDGVGRLLHGPSLIGVKAALHHGHAAAAEAAKDELPFVIRRGRAFHVGNLPIGDHDGALHLVSQKAQAGTQDQQHPGAEAPQTGLQGSGALLVLGITQGGGHSLPPHSRQKPSPSWAAAPQVGQEGACGWRPRASLMSASWAFSPSISWSLASSSSDSVGVPV